MFGGWDKGGQAENWVKVVEDVESEVGEEEEEDEQTVEDDENENKIERNGMATREGVWRVNKEVGKQEDELVRQRKLVPLWSQY